MTFFLPRVFKWMDFSSALFDFAVLASETFPRNYDYTISRETEIEEII